MEKHSHALIAGLFALAAIAAAVWAGFWLSGEDKDQSPYLLVSQSSVSGLMPQAYVRLRGVQVGKVESIRFDPQNPRLILVKIQVDKGTPITEGTYAQLGFQGVTGLAHVRLEDRGNHPEPVKTHPSNPARIELRPSLFEQIGSSGEALLTNVNQTLARLNAFLSDENQVQFSSALANIKDATAKIAQAATELQQGAKALPEVAQSIEQGLKPLPALANDAKKALARADALLTNLNSVAADVRNKQVLDKLAQSAERVGDTGEAVGDAILQGTLPRLDQLIADLNKATHNLDRLIAELKQNPRSLVFGKPAPAPGPGEPGFIAPRNR
jgi:phospholipid/cholesterol/gamma-HCH transport system substrate-binding protein